MMQLNYSICCKLDVHKQVIVATIVITNTEGISEYIQKSFTTINSDIQKLHNWLVENNCYHVCMESTGKYWIPIFNYLENNTDVVDDAKHLCSWCGLSPANNESAGKKNLFVFQKLVII